MKTKVKKVSETVNKEGAPVMKSNLEIINDFLNGTYDAMENSTEGKEENNGTAYVTHKNVGAISISGLPFNNSEGLELAIATGCPLDSWTQSAYLSTKHCKIKDYSKVVIEYNGNKFSLDDAIRFIAQGSKNVALATKAFANNIGVKTMDFATFKKNVKPIPSNDYGLACCKCLHIENTNTYLFIYEDKDNLSYAITMYDNGVYRINKQKELKYKISNSSPFISVNAYKLGGFFSGKTMSVEQYVRMHMDVMSGTMLEHYRFNGTANVNVMDASANEITREKRGLTLKLIHSNLEYCTPIQNTTHGRAMAMIWEKYGRVYRLSAHDPILNTNYKDLTLAYLDKYYVRVK